MERIILSNRMPKVEYLREYKGTYYFVQDGNLCEFFDGEVKVLAPRDRRFRCIGTDVEDGLYYIFNDRIYRITNREKSIDSIEINLCDAEACCLKNGFLYWKQRTKIIRMAIGSKVVEECDLNVKTQATRLVVEGNILFISDVRGYLHLVDRKSGKDKCNKLHEDSIQDFLVSGKQLITVSRDRKVKKYNIVGDKLEFVKSSISLPHFVNCITKAGDNILGGLSNGQIAVLDCDLEGVKLKRVHHDAIRFLQIVAESILTNSDDGCCYLIDLKSIERRIRKKLIYGAVQDKIQCSAYDGHTLYIGFLSGKIEKIEKMKETDLGNYTRSVVSRQKNVRSLCVSDKIILAGLENGDIYDVAGNRCLAKDGDTPYSMAYLGRKLIVGRRDGYVDLYEAGEEFRHLKHIQAHRSVIGDILIRENGFITCSDDQSFCFWDPELNLVSTERVSEKNTALNNVMEADDALFISSDNGCIYRIEDGVKDEIFVSRQPIRSLYYNEDVIFVGDRRGNVFRYANNIAEKIYSGCARVVDIYPGENSDRIMVVFEDVVITMEGKGMSRDKVFIIHGHNNELKREVQLLLEKQNIDSIVLNERPDRGRTIIDKLIEEAAPATFAIATLTPDDVVVDPSGTGTVYRARQNVVLEIGYFLGKLGKDRVVMLRMKDVEVPSDLAGIVYKNVDSIEEGKWKMELANELDEAGFTIDFRKLVKG